MNTQVLLVRHGQTDSNLRHAYMGRSAEPLTSAGREQASLLAARLAGTDRKPFISSPLARAMETACLASDLPRGQIQTGPAFIEIDFGPFSGLNRDEVADRYPEAWRAWRNDPATFRLNGAETLQQVQERAWTGLVQVLEQYRDGKPVIVTHDAVIRCLLLKALNIGLHAYRSFNVDNTSLTGLLRGKTRFYLTVFNDTCHLR